MTTEVVEPSDGTQLIAYCGIYCGSCPNRTGEIADLARDLRKKLREYRFERIAPALSAFLKPLANYPQCYETLGAMVKLRCKRGCRDNGGPPQCKIRNCTRRHDFQGCWECTDFETCEKLNLLKPTHGDAHLKNLKKYRNMASMRSLQERNIGEHWLRGHRTTAKRHCGTNKIRLERIADRFCELAKGAGYLSGKNRDKVLYVHLQTYILSRISLLTFQFKTLQAKSLKVPPRRRC